MLHKIYHTELAGGYAYLTKTLPGDGEIPLLITQRPSKYALPVDAPDALDSPLPRLRKDTSAPARLTSKVDLPIDHLTAANEKFFDLYQDWAHQNPGTHLDGGTEKYGEWQ